MTADFQALATQFLDAWNSHSVDRVLAVYTDDVVYRDPNLKTEIQGADAFRPYLTKLFEKWRMTWAVREAHSLSGQDGYALLWHGTFTKFGGTQTVETDGMDLVILNGDRVCRNEVYFDRAVLAALNDGLKA